MAPGSGLPTTADDLRAAAARITETKKRVNLAQGWTRALDTLPPRLLESNGEGPHIDPMWLARQAVSRRRALLTPRGLPP